MQMPRKKRFKSIRYKTVLLLGALYGVRKNGARFSPCPRFVDLYKPTLAQSVPSGGGGHISKAFCLQNKET